MSDAVDKSTVRDSYIAELLRPALLMAAAAVSFAAVASAWLSVLFGSKIHLQTESAVRRRRGRI